MLPYRRILIKYGQKINLRLDKMSLDKKIIGRKDIGLKDVDEVTLDEVMSDEKSVHGVKHVQTLPMSQVRTFNLIL